LLRQYGAQVQMMRLVARGVSPLLMQPLAMESIDLASAASRAARAMGMMAMFLLMSAFMGGLNAALDTTAGERERGSLEPLLLNPAERVALVLGKWGAVASLGMLIAVLSSFSFIPSQWLLRGDTLQALFQYGWREALLFLAVLLPFAAALSALLMAVAIR